VSQDPDIAIVGAGILGLAVARELLERQPSRRVTVLEREDGIGRHQTGHNSGVIHAGIYYQPGSLKAQLCVEGAKRMYAFCADRGVAHEKVGKLIVATDQSEMQRFDELERRGQANGVPGLKRVDAAGVREIEPHCTTAIAGLHSPETGIADFPGVARALADEVREKGGEIRLGVDVTAMRKTARGVQLDLATGERIDAKTGVVCAGLWADRFAVAAGASGDPRIVPFRGGYLKLTPKGAELVKGLIYPVPDPDLPFLGVHLTRHISGEVWLGPTALFVGARDAYALKTIRPKDVKDSLTWPGTWKVFRRFWRTGIDEIRMATSRKAFVKACRTYVPDLTTADVAPGTASAGIRAQAVGRDGKLFDDFLLQEAEGALHVRNAPSPAATSSLALASMITDKVEKLRS
jgi:L-2-hydroxyglutarate oxidase